MNRKLKLSLYLAAIFIAGVVTGMFISYQVARRLMPSRERMASRWCGELQSRLDLTPEQMTKIRPIIDGALTDFKDDLTRDMLGSLSNSYVCVAQLLNPEQKSKLEQFQKEQEQFIRTTFGREVSAK